MNCLVHLRVASYTKLLASMLLSGSAIIYSRKFFTGLTDKLTEEQIKQNRPPLACSHLSACNGRTSINQLAPTLYCELNILYLQDRYAEREALPPIDPSQDWFLVRGEEDGGYTILEFTRNWTTCDDRDRDIEVIWTSYLYFSQVDLLLNIIQFQECIQ